MELQLRNQYFYTRIESPTQVNELLKDLSKKSIFLVIDHNVDNDFLRKLIIELENRGVISGKYLHDGSEPSTKIVEEVKREVNKVENDSIMGIGGGSTLDLMKAISVLHDQSITAADAQGAKLNIKQKLFSFAVPTTAGSGAEATKSAVVTNLDAKLKRGINHLRVLPDVALLAPRILEEIPSRIFVASVFDGITHAIESLIGKSGSKDVKATARFALAIYVRQVRQLFRDDSVKIDTQILEASYFAGVAICNSETGPIHAISYPLSEHCNYGHGEAIGLLLPKVLRIYIESDKKLGELLESSVGMAPYQFVTVLEEIYAKYVENLKNPKPINNIDMLAARSLELLGAINNSPVPWNESLSKEVLQKCI